MPSIRVIRNRIRGVKNITKITRAMEMIAASKMKRAQERGLAGRPYVEKIHQVIADLAALQEPQEVHPLLVKRPAQNIAIVHITPDRGLCGGLNANLNRLTGGFVLEQKVPVSLVTVGRKGRDFMMRHGCKVIAEFTHLGDQPVMFDILPISKIIIDGYSSAAFDVVYVVYARFVNTMLQKPVMEQVLPVQPAVIPRAQNVEYIYEPGPQAVLGELLPRFVETQLYHAILESIASEQSARMVAMKAATDNGNELVSQLTLAYNKARQEAITTEILDIAGGAEALA
ncbi:MAG: ATP synthase F1 subunit gamma [Chloroflexi bacterium]|nr:ATP synthase F1 subunit gamma [Chloroflexota bacterium]